MKNYLEGVKFRIIDMKEYQKSNYMITFDMMHLQELIAKCKQKNLKQEMCNYYNELFILKDNLKKEKNK